MFFDPIEIPDPLLEAQEQGKLVIFAGAGVAMGAPSNLPSFKGLAAKIAGSHPLASEIEHYDARLDQFLGELARQKVDVHGLCREIIGNPASQPTELHRSVANLFTKPEHVRIVTTNFESHFPSVLFERRLKFDIFHAPALPLGNEFTGVVYLHGHITRPEPLVLTDEDFGRAYLTEGWAREFLQRLFTEFTTLFVGYSHNDIPVEYLARGMTGKSMAPRFALTASGEKGKWASLGISEIPFEKASGTNPFQNLYTGLKRWAEFTKQQPTEIAERIKNIVRAPETVIPDKSQSSLMLRCLERDDSCHFFTSEANGWRWVKWLHEQKLLGPLFDTSGRGLKKPQVELAYWLATQLLAVRSDDGLLLVEQYRGNLGDHLWNALCRKLWLNTEIDWNSPLIQKWVLLLIETCPATSLGSLSHLSPKGAKSALHTLGLAFLRRLTAVRAVITRAVDFDGLFKNASLAESEPQVEAEAKTGSEIFKSKDKAAYEIALVSGDIHELDTAWETYFKPRLLEIGEPLILLLENRLRETHELYQAAERSDSNYDPFCGRGRIYDRDVYRSGRDVNILLEFLLDVIEAIRGSGCSLSEWRIISWLNSRVPVLVRVGLYALHLSNAIPKPRKVELLQNHALIYPSIYGATHEVLLILSDCYPALDVNERKSLWQTINKGPSLERPEDVALADWEESRQYTINKLTWLLATANSGCPESAAALKALQERAPDFQGYKGMDQVILDTGVGFDGPRSPKSVGELLSSAPTSQLDWLLSYKGGKAPFEESRDGLLHEVGAACAQNQAWGIALLEQLGSRHAWSSDLWNAAFSRMSLAAFPEDKLNWLLKSLEDHFGDSPSLRGLAFFLFHSIDLAEGKRPSAENIEVMIRISLLIWKQLKNEKAAVSEGFKEKEWTSYAINHPAGQVVEFWLKCCDLQRRGGGEPIPGFPAWLAEPLANIVDGKDFASQLGRAMLALHFRFVYQVDPAWATAKLFPKFQFSKVGQEAFLMWEPHLCHGNLSRDLILVMPSLYREAFPHFQSVSGHLLTGLFRHVAVIVHSCLFNVNENNWFRDFLTLFNDEQKAHWVQQFQFCLRGSPEARKVQIWNQWMKPYWEDRLHGRPCALLPKEAEEMLECVFLVGEAFPEAVNLVTRGPRTDERIGIIVHELENHNSPEKYPDAVLQLLEWSLRDHKHDWMIPKDIEPLLFRLPKKKTFLPTLNSICQHLASLKYAGATDLKRRIEREFTSET